MKYAKGVFDFLLDFGNHIKIKGGSRLKDELEWASDFAEEKL